MYYFQGDYNFPKIESKFNIYNILKKFDDLFYTSLSSRIGSLTDYAAKLATYSEFYGVTDSDYVIGYVAFYCNDTEEHIAFLAQIAICKKYQGVGIGKKLLNLAEKKSKGVGCKTMRLQVDRRDSKVIKFYQCNGYSFENNELSYMKKEL